MGRGYQSIFASFCSTINILIQYVFEILYCVLSGQSSKVLNNDAFMSLKIVFILINSADPDECGMSSGSSLFAEYLFTENGSITAWNNSF